MTAPDVVIVGGGAIGLSIAWRSAGRGLSVVVVDERPGRGASWAAAGMLAPVTEAHYGEEALLRLNLEAARSYPAFIAELEQAAGQRAGYRESGTLVVARDTDENAAFEELYRFQLRLGLQVERLRGRECRELEPALSPRVRGGILVAGDHQVDNRALVRALIKACERAGVAFATERAAALVTEPSVGGVQLAGGDKIHAGKVVLAAGCWSGRIKGLPPGIAPRVRPVKGQLIHMRDPAGPGLAGRTVRGADVYAVPRGDGRLVVGATSEEQGFNTSVTAGGVYTLLRDVYELLPGITELELVETVCGLRPASPDNAPIIGLSGLDDLLVATGHYRSGILLAPVTADSISEILCTGTVPERIAPFSPQRWQPAQKVAS